MKSLRELLVLVAAVAIVVFITATVWWLFVRQYLDCTQPWTVKGFQDLSAAYWTPLYVLVTFLTLLAVVGNIWYFESTRRRQNEDWKRQDQEQKERQDAFVWTLFLQVAALRVLSFDPHLGQEQQDHRSRAREELERYWAQFQLRFPLIGSSKTDPAGKQAAQ